MSKAFLKDDITIESPVFVPLNLTEGANYLTVDGYHRLQKALHAIASGESSDGRAPLSEESRAHKEHLEQVLRTATVIDPLSQNGPRALFGATVTVLDSEDNEKTFSLVGVPEADPRAGKISWISPIGKALLGKSAGDVVTVQTPKRVDDFEVLKVEYKRIG